jgi:hypothetical protein
MKTKTQNKKENEKPKRDFLWWGLRVSFGIMVGLIVDAYLLERQIEIAIIRVFDLSQSAAMLLALFLY